MNTFKEPVEETTGGFSNRLKKIHDFDFSLNRDNIPKLIPFILYICLWVILYIANHHYGEKTLSEMDKVRHEVKELKADFYTMNARLSNKSVQSEVVKAISSTGLKELTSPPQRIKLIK